MFELEGERFLASSAIPGVPVGLRSTTVEAAQKAKMPEARLDELWEKLTESLRQLGVKLVPLPE